MAIYDIDPTAVSVAVRRLKMSPEYVAGIYEHNAFTHPSIKEIMIGYGNGAFGYARAKQKLENLIA